METEDVWFEPPSEEEVEELRAFMSSDRVSEDCMTLSEADGFLTGLLIGPKTPPPEEWGPMIFGDWPDWAEAEAAKFVGVIVRRADEIELGLESDPPTFVPWLDEDDDGRRDAARWADGFIEAVGLETRRWERAIRTAEAGMFLIPILMIAGTDEEAGEESLPIPPEAEEYVAELREEMAENVDELIRECVVGMYDYWLTAAHQATLKSKAAKRKRVKHKRPHKRPHKRR